MSREDRITDLEGTVVKKEKGGFIVEIQPGGEGTETKNILCSLSGKLRMNYIRIVLGDRVKISMSPYDLTRGTITYRLK